MIRVQLNHLREGSPKGNTTLFETKVFLCFGAIYWNKILSYIKMEQKTEIQCKRVKYYMKWQSPHKKKGNSHYSF